ncbi:MAG: pyruvate:ferredoxin (flavodoxin) oxidoreductase [Planctomycetes bacterium]|nr:pyruvate:ferredoxin (flavodoxin) oxidoreductase [Planctomycetota bacterium]
MARRPMLTCDGNEATASVAHRLNEVIAIYPITPSSNMGEHADEWSARGRKNIWGTVPLVVEMQSEGGAAGAVHGALQTGSLTTTFTASQGLLLMIPNMFKIAGELTSTVFHVSARTVATHALSIFGDHSDVMACRSTGWAMLCSGSVQEAQDFALVAQAATLEGRVPVLHFFDGFRTSHEVSKIETLADEDLRAMIDDDLVAAHRARGLTPDRPVLRGTAQNPDVFFQAREAVNPFYEAFPAAVKRAMDRFAAITGRRYSLFDYAGHPEAERVVVLMGSGAEIAHEAVDRLVAAGEKVGVLKVRLFRPFVPADLLAALPPTVKALSVLDRTKEPGAAGEPLYKDVLSAVAEAQAEGALPMKKAPRVVGGRYGLSSKEFTPAMVKAALDGLLERKPRNRFTLGIRDDVSGSSLDFDPEALPEEPDVVRAMFFGLGADGTVSANKNSIKIIGEETDNYAQGYFVYDSKKSGAITTSHLRFGPRPIRSSYLIREASFIACHQWVFLEKYDMLRYAAPGAVFLLNAPGGAAGAWDRLPRKVQEDCIARRLRVFAIDAYAVAEATGMGTRINTIMQTCFFAISGVLPREDAIAKIKEAVKKTYGGRGEDVVRRNYEAVDRSLAALHEIPLPAAAASGIGLPPTVPDGAPEFVKRFTAPILAGRGDDLPVSAFSPDGTFPTATSQWEKRAIALEIPLWDPDACVQCGKCAMVCPHAAIRTKVYPPSLLDRAPAGFKSRDYRSLSMKGMKYTIQTSPEDCTGCNLCVEVCPTHTVASPRHGSRFAKPEGDGRLPRWVRDKRRALNMAPLAKVREEEKRTFSFFLDLPEADRTLVDPSKIDSSQVLRPLFEYSGACSGCGETPYVKLLSQLFGDRALVANATGCSSIYGGNLPTTPWAVDDAGRGPAWSNSLFEDNAEFGYGFRLTLDRQEAFAKELLQRLGGALDGALVQGLLGADMSTEAGIRDQRIRVAELKKRLASLDGARSGDAKRLLSLADFLVRKSVWIVGGDGWAYDIGYGGLDHVLASGRDVNVLVLDTEVYSNTGGQMSKATPMGAVAKFAAGGKPTGKKDLAMLAMSYGNVYVARVAMGADDRQTLRAFLEAESWHGPSIIIAYSHCIAHGIEMEKGLQHQRRAVESGLWNLVRFDPRRAAEGLPPLQIDSAPPRLRLKDAMYEEVRWKMLTRMAPAEAERLLRLAQEDADARERLYRLLARGTIGPEEAAKASDVLAAAAAAAAAPAPKAPKLPLEV